MIVTQQVYKGELNKNIYTVGDRSRYSKTLSIKRNYAGQMFASGKHPDSNAYFVTLGEVYAGFSENELLEFFAAFLAVRSEYEMEQFNGTD